MPRTGFHLVLAAMFSAFSAAIAPGAVTGPGDIAFTGFNADGSDDLAFVLLADVTPGTTVYFTDKEWNGGVIGSGGAFNTGEGGFSWTSPGSLLSAGTVIRLSSLTNSPNNFSTNIGTVDYTFGVTSAALSGDDETVYAYLGSPSSPTAFLAAVQNTNVLAEGSLVNTGLTLGTTAVRLANGIDIGAYNGPRTGQPNFADYLSLINNPANWLTQDGAGDQSNDGIAPNVPFATTAFTISPVPEPSTSALVALVAAAGLMFRRRAVKAAA